ncbi:MAG TPA: fatty acid CoA ligase family protein [Xanthomonadales bacterium]|nr:fatty acid CoA ligase family protein [Xanthomonadales bacterium]
MDKPLSKSWDCESLCNVAGALAEQSKLQPDVIAVRYPDERPFRKGKYRTCSYYQLDHLSNRYAHGLQAYGIGPGVRTVLMVSPGLEFIAMFFALFKAGAIPVLIDPGMGLKPLEQCLREAEPQAFVGIFKAQMARKLKGWAKDSCKSFVTVGPSYGLNRILGSISTRQLTRLASNNTQDILHPAKGDDMAAILFTSGSTGAPKGVVYRHRHFTAQVGLLKRSFEIEPGEVGLSTFPPFALFDPALGMTTVVPRMDPSRPAAADPQHLVDIIEEFQITSIFGSPALMDNLSRFCEQNKLRMWSPKRVISAGAAVPIATIRRMEQVLANDALIHTPYGATECLPVSTVSSAELNKQVTEMTESGEGICVGKPVAPNRVRVIRITDNAIGDLSEVTDMPIGMVGEIIVNGPSCTDTYWAREADTQLAKINGEDGAIWHRMGDAGILDGRGCLWYCGRLSQRVNTGTETLFPDQVEGIFNQHPDAARTALVGVGPQGAQVPVLCVELLRELAPVDMERVHYDLLQLAQAFPLTRSVRTVLFHPGFPVDSRHNSKIHRDELAAWALQKMQQS